MNDDLNILVTYISTSKQLMKIAVKIEHGLNREEFDNLKYFAEPETLAKFKEILPMYVSNHIDFIVGVDDIFVIVECGKEI